jgi:hypothetical protein
MIELDIRCERCNAVLEYTVHYERFEVEIDVLPCEACIQEERDKAYDSGFADGEERGEWANL